MSGQIARMKDYILCVSKQHEVFSGLIGEIALDTETYPCVNASNPREIRRIQSGIPSKYRDKNHVLKGGEVISAGNMNLVLKSNLVIKDGLLAKELVIEGNYGSNNLPNLKLDDENWKVRLIEEEFMKRMWDVEGI